MRAAGARPLFCITMTQSVPSALHTSKLHSLPLLARGKVRDNYAVGSDRILMVASDRLSAFDVIMGEPIPGKGALLIDEIDKADIEFPNDLLREIDRMEFYCYETRELIRAKHRPLVFITSNNEKELPDAFLRRCFFHYIKFPEPDTMRQIVAVHFPTLKSELLTAAMKTFYDVRNLPGLKKKPSTSELLDWLKLLVAEEIPLSALQSADNKVSVPPLVGALLKNEQDVSLFEKLVMMNQRNR